MVNARGAAGNVANNDMTVAEVEAFLAQRAAFIAANGAHAAKIRLQLSGANIKSL